MYMYNIHVRWYNHSFFGEKPIVYFYCLSNSLKCTGVNGKALQVHVHAHVCALDMKRLILYYKSHENLCQYYKSCENHIRYYKSCVL